VAGVYVLQVEAAVAVDDVPTGDEHFTKLLVHANHTEHQVVRCAVLLLDLLKLFFERLFPSDCVFKSGLEVSMIFLAILLL
jgi:hypothetical protein